MAAPGLCTRWHERSRALRRFLDGGEGLLRFLSIESMGKFVGTLDLFQYYSIVFFFEENRLVRSLGHCRFLLEGDFIGYA